MKMSNQWTESKHTWVPTKTRLKRPRTQQPQNELAHHVQSWYSKNDPTLSWQALTPTIQPSALKNKVQIQTVHTSVFVPPSGRPIFLNVSFWQQTKSTRHATREYFTSASLFPASKLDSDKARLSASGATTLHFLCPYSRIKSSQSAQHRKLTKPCAFYNCAHKIDLQRAPMLLFSLFYAALGNSQCSARRPD